MEGNARIWFTPKQKAELWERWKSGQCVADMRLNQRPRKTLGFETPADRLRAVLH